MAFWSKKREIDDVETAEAPPASAAQLASAKAQPGQTSSQIAAKQLSADELLRKAADSKKRLAVFGEIVAIFMRSPQFRAMSVAELEALVVPAVNNNQFFVVESQSKENGVVAPVGAALWASVSAEVDQRLSSNLDQPITLSASEWKSGDIGWLIAAAGDSRVLSPVLRQISETVLKGAPLKLRTRDKDGQVTIATFSPAAS